MTNVNEETERTQSDGPLVSCDVDREALELEHQHCQADATSDSPYGHTVTCLFSQWVANRADVERLTCERDGALKVLADHRCNEAAERSHRCAQKAEEAHRTCLEALEMLRGQLDHNIRRASQAEATVRRVEALAGEWDAGLPATDEDEPRLWHERLRALLAEDRA